jgi:uncharacterized membrane protein YhaH (DUF805 family)
MLGFLVLSGRANRLRWWLVSLLSLPVIITGVLLSGAISTLAPLIGMPLMLAALLVPMWASICVTVQRYHDRGKSGFWYWIALIPFIGGIWQVIECGFCSGDIDDNQYGSPLGSAVGSSYSGTGDSISYGRSESALSSKFDDAYFANAAKKLAKAEQTQQSSGSMNRQISFGKCGVTT